MLVEEQSFNQFDIAKYTFNEDQSGSEREKLKFMAKMSENAERYDDMRRFMKEMVLNVYGGKFGLPHTLTMQERNLLSVAYKNVVGARRSSWRIVKDDYIKNPNSEQLLSYKTTIERELDGLCDEILELLRDYCLKDEDAVAVDAKVFYKKMVGDYIRYTAEYAEGNELAHKTKQAEKTYHNAYEDAAALNPTNPIRLGLSLNYSVFLYEIVKHKEDACALAKTAFDDAIQKLDTLEEIDYKDSTLIMQLLRDNLTLWIQENEEDD